MARHRDVRNMDYSDEYEGYDDVYGHSMDDDYYISPSNRQFMYNRENSAKSSEEGIKEEDEVEAELTDIDRLKLESCIDEIRSILGNTIVPRNDLVNIIVTQKFDVEKSVNAILENTKYQQTEERKEKDDKLRSIRSRVSKLNGLKNMNQNEPVKEFKTSKPFVNSHENKTSLNNKLPAKDIFVPNINKSSSEKNTSDTKIDLDKTLKKMDNLQLSDTKSLTLNESKSPVTNDWHIDLTKALIVTRSVPSVSHSTKNANEKFEIPFIACEEPKSLTSNEFKSPVTKDWHIDLTKALKTRSVPSVSHSTKNANEKFEIPFVECDKPKCSTANEFKSPVTNDWHIDLTKALKITRSLPSVSNSTKNTDETFEIPFVDCEEEIPLPKNRKLLPCKFDASDILSIHSKYEKYCSRFGKVLCLTIRKRRPVIKTCDDYLRKVKRFNFSKASPDDFIRSHLRR